MANKAPSAIKADVKQLSASISTIDGLLRKLADTKLSDAAKVSKEVTPKLNAAINDKRLDAATGRINVWATKNCG